MKSDYKTSLLMNSVYFILLLAFPLLGIIVMWLFARWSKKWKIFFSILFLLPLILAVTIFPFIVQPYKITGTSMTPTLVEGEYFLANKLVYRNTSPQRGDIVVFKNPTKPETENVKRIIGLPGEELEIENGHVYINNAMLEEPYLSNDITTEADAYIKNGQPVIAPQDQYLVLGDNRKIGSDSRDYGSVPKDYIVGKYWFSYFPF